MTAINFVAIVLFVPETRFDRVDVVTETAMDSSQEKVANADVKSLRRPSDESAPQTPKKTFIQELSLWSGTPKTNLLKMFIR